jgi:hypothetical protein
VIAALVCRLFGHRRGAARELRLESSRTSIHMELCPRCRAEHEIDHPAGMLVRVVAQGHVTPRGFGVAWIDWQTDNAVCMPMPLNVLAAAGRRAWTWVKFPHCLFTDPRQAFLQGYQMGLRAGQQHDGEPAP